MQTELEKWIAAHTIKIAAFDEPAFIIRPDDLRALLAGKVLCENEPVAWMCPIHEDLALSPREGWLALYAPAESDKPDIFSAAKTGFHFCSVVRESLIGSKELCKHCNADIGKPACDHAPAQMTTQWDHGTEIGNPFCIKCGGSISKEIDNE
jgi:hypothetical protein